MTFGLPQKTISQLRSVFKNHPEITQVKIYGSRARGHYRRGSDIDLAFFSESEKDLSSNLSWELDDLPSPYIFDLVNYNTLNDSPLKEEIDKYGKVFYKKNIFSPSQQKSSSKKKTSKRQLLFPKKPSVQKKQKATLNNELGISSNLKGSVVNLGNVAEVSSGNSAPQNRHLFQNGSYPFCRTSDVGKVHISDNFKEINDYLNDEGIKGLTLFRKNTILFPKSGVSTFLNHRVILGIDSYVSNHLATIYANEKKILTKFLFNWLCLIDAKELTNDQTYPSLKLSEIRKIKIPCPSLPEQEKIAEILSQIQRSIKIQDEFIETTKELKQSTMKQLFTYGVKGQKTKQTETGEIPENWKICPFKNCIRKITFNRFKQIQKNQYLKIGRFPIIDQGKSFVSGWTNDKTNILNKELPIIVFGDHTRVFKYIDKPFALGADGTKLIKPNNDYNIKYFYYLMQKISIPNKGYNRHFKLLKEIPLPCPPLSEQKKISGILTKIDQKIQIHKNKKSSLEELFKTMLNKLMIRQIRIHKLDINIYSTRK